MHVYLSNNFEVSSLILTGFRQSGNFTFPLPHHYHLMANL